MQPLVVAADLIAVVVAVSDAQPRVLARLGGDALPAGPFASEHRSLQSGLRSWVEQQTRHPLGYVEQLYTFADSDRGGPSHPPGPEAHASGGPERASAGRAISVSYLGLTREAQAQAGAGWRGWYEYFPWEDRRDGRGASLVGDAIAPRLLAWAEDAAPGTRAERLRRAGISFGLRTPGCGQGPPAWNEELVLGRYELLHEAGLVAEAGHPGLLPGRPMVHDHRRILATGIARLRAKIKYRPVVFELMPDSFTLLQLQRAVEALAGRLLHKPNFRRLVEQQNLVEDTGATTAETGGRPAKLVRFRREVLLEREAAGSKLPLARTP